MLCPKCGYMMSAFDKECPRCQGRGLPQTQHLPAAAPPSVAPQPTVPLSGYNPPSVPPAFAAPSPVTPPSATPVTPTQHYCNGCGTPNSGAAAFCAGCGQSLTALAPVAAHPGADAWVTPQPAYPPQPYQQQGYPPPHPQQPYPAQPYQQPYYGPPQNNVNVVVTQQNNNNSSGWLAALLVLLFGTPLGCIAVPAALLLMAVAFQFTPLIVAAIIAIAIAKSPMEKEQKTIAILVSVGIGVVANLALLGAMYSH